MVYKLCQLYSCSDVWYTRTLHKYNLFNRCCPDYYVIKQVYMKQNAFIEKVADKIKDLGLTAPVILLLEANKPLVFIGSQLLLIAQPTLDLLLPRNIIQNSIDLLADPTQLERLIVALETESFQPAQLNPQDPDFLNERG